MSETGSPRRPEVIVLDVNETLSDMSPLAQRFSDVGAPAHLATTWFAQVLRDGFALAAAGADEPFARIAAGVLRTTFYPLELDRVTEDAISHVMDGFGLLPVHPDVPDGLRALHDLGIRLVTLSNGSASVAEDLLDRAGVRETCELLLSVEDAGAWKPAASSYAYALERCRVTAADAMLVAAHPWDVDGASRAGLATAWIDREGAPYPSHFTAPTVRATTLTGLAEQLR